MSDEPSEEPGNGPAPYDGADEAQLSDQEPQSADEAQLSDQEPQPLEAPAVEAPISEPDGPAAPQATIAGRVWVAIIAAAVGLVLLIIFIAENTAKVKISFLGISGQVPIGLALLIAGVAGIILTLLVGTTRIVQLRREVRHRGRRRQA